MAEAAEGLLLEKFKEEGKLLSKLSASNLSIVRVFDFGLTPSPVSPQVPYLVLEWLEGKSLEEWLLERRNEGLGRLSEREAIELLSPAVDAIADAHAMNVAHRDIKPANLFCLPRSGRQTLKILDFGIAKAMQEGETATQVKTRTSSGFSAFSPSYGSPEQFFSKRYGATGPWTDVYALGLCLVELVSGRPPLDGDDVQELLESSTSEQRPTPQARGATVSDAFEAVCAKALAKMPKDRYANASELMNALAPLLAVDVAPNAESRAEDPSRAPDPVERVATRPEEKRQGSNTVMAAPLAESPPTHTAEVVSLEAASTDVPVRASRKRRARRAEGKPAPKQEALPPAPAKSGRKLPIAGMVTFGGVTALSITLYWVLHDPSTPQDHTSASARASNAATSRPESPSKLPPPAPLPRPRHVAQLAMGPQHTCALTTEKEVLCFGKNTHGEIGLAPETTGADAYTPDHTAHLVPGLNDVIQVAAGESFTCAVQADGGLLCWGKNDTSALGDGTTVDRSAPTPVLGITDALQVSIRGGSTCALRRDHTVSCWGDVGIAKPVGTEKNPLAPVPVRDLKDAVELAMGDFFGCARLSDGRVSCWGSGAFGVLGDGTEFDRFAGRAVPGLSDIVELSAGVFHACARKSDGEVLCWGDNEYGQLGDGTNIQRDVPTRVPKLGVAARISTGDQQTCALLTSGRVLCWGDSQQRALGTMGTDVCKFSNGELPCSRTPIPFSSSDDNGFPGTPTVSVAMASNRTCVISGDGRATCTSGVDRPVAEILRCLLAHRPKFVSGIPPRDACARFPAHRLSSRAEIGPFKEQDLVGEIAGSEEAVDRERGLAKERLVDLASQLVVAPSSPSSVGPHTHRIVAIPGVVADASGVIVAGSALYFDRHGRRRPHDDGHGGELRHERRRAMGRSEGRG